MSFAFDDSQNLQAVTMTDSQMQETQGAWIGNAFGGLMGGVGGHYGYMASAVASGTYNRNAHLAAIGTGAVVGGINGYASTTGKNIKIR
ncbi:hypothetical protein LU293_09765 [Moraxella nasovis]|uniref:hypothetical protein n=1 Tax=Moraxella nasovis TaxID=2904121 RepID=UPI001F623DAE|nr:hypothetical protein [Moraxella nasovis]UNU73333.1 hypothetical protein LU293_09765 [Moraxella nasovis]